MIPGGWTQWPAWEFSPRETQVLRQTAWRTWGAKEESGEPVTRRASRHLLRAAIPAALVYTTFSGRRVGLVHGILAAVAMCGVAVCVWTFNRTLRERRLVPSLVLAAVLLAAAGASQWAGYSVPVVALCYGCAIVGMQRLPLAAALPLSLVALGGYTVLSHESWLSSVMTVIGIGMAGYLLRLDGESRRRLRVQEEAARAAEAESAALSERARIARDIHDVLAHSLSAQLVHLEAARLRIEQEPPGPFRDQILQRVVGARSMAREGLAETRQALSALRGEMAPLGDYLRELAATDGAEVEVSGTPRPVPAEASQAVRRVVQEALTNVRKHAPGARVRIALTYGTDDVTLAVRDSGGKGQAPAGLGSSGSGYGLLGMRERAELLGGTLEAGPEGGEEKGFTVRLRVPA